jgi:hypothetical protein
LSFGRLIGLRPDSTANQWEHGQLPQAPNQTSREPSRNLIIVDTGPLVALLIIPMRRTILIFVFLSAVLAAARETPDIVHTFDARPLRQLDLRAPGNAARVWDTMHLLAALQGLANRDAPRFHLFYTGEFNTDSDQFWFDWYRGEDGWLKSAKVHSLTGIEEALAVFRDAYRGLVVYDGNVPATSNVASTAAGCDRLLPVRFDPAPDSLFTLLTEKLGIPVRLWLVESDGRPRFTGRGTVPDSGQPSSGSAKIDAYRWAISKYLQSGRTDPFVAAYYVDAHWLKRPWGAGADMHTLSNHDYFIARRAFFFDLSPWGDELPTDDPEQAMGLDRQTMLDVLRLHYEGSNGGIIKIGGFPPWPFKYTTTVGGRRDGVPTEWEFTRLISQFNAYHEADAANVGAMANASFHQHYPLQERYPQPNRKPGVAEWKAKGYIDEQGKVAPRCYVGHYVGDYDSPAWLYKAVAAFFQDPRRGEVPLGWAFGPNLSERAPQAFVYAYRHATTNDFFIAANSGAGYLNARALTVRPESGLPSGLEAWTRYNLQHYARWDMTITGFVLDGSAGASTAHEWRAYRQFSPDGLGTHFERGPAMHLGVPACPERDLPDKVEKAAAAIARDAAGSDAGPVFQWRRSILKPPSWYARLSEILEEQYPEARVVVVDPYTFFGLIRHHLSE